MATFFQVIKISACVGGKNFNSMHCDDVVNEGVVGGGTYFLKYP